MRFSVVIPVYNEVDNILPLIEEIMTVFVTENDYELIVVDDASIDGTTERLRIASADNPRLRVLCHAQRCGQSSALYSGIRAAKGQLVVTLDGDGQNDPADIPGLLKRYQQEADDWLLLAGRRVRRQDSWLTRLSSRLANAVRRRILGDATPDTGCGLKLFPRDLFLALPAFNHMHRFLPALAQRAGARTLSVVVQTRPRRHGMSKYGVHNRLWVGIIDLLGVLWLQRRRMQPRVTELK